MSGSELRASLSLTAIFALRMLGLFLVLPVFALEARAYPGGDDPALVGIAMGLYGLTQALFQIPFGIASDRYGRKPVIVMGLLVFAAGSLLAAAADSLAGLMVGRTLQGAGAVSAAVTALLADQTRDQVRTKAMAMVGASIGLMFALSLVLSPLLAARIGLSGLFAMTGVMALGAVAVLLWVNPAEPARREDAPRGRLVDVLADAALMRLNLGAFVLHAVQISMWVGVPVLLAQAGLDQAHHWWIYLPTVLASFLILVALLFPLERKGHLRGVYLGAIALLAAVQLGLQLVSAADAPSLPVLAGLLLLFFSGFNVLEATQPSLVTRIADRPMRGMAMGAYNTMQSLGLFAGGALGGWLAKTVGLGGMHMVFLGAALLWLWLAWPLKMPERRSH